MYKSAMINKAIKILAILKKHAPSVKWEEVYVAGGAVRSMVMNEEPKDYDIYCVNNAVARRITNELENNKEIKIKYSTDNAFTFKIDSTVIQIVKEFYGEPKDIIKNFDFTNCMGYIHATCNEVYISPEMYKSIAEKSLVYTGSSYPVASMLRGHKFIRRGWHFSAGQVLKVMLDINKLDLLDPAVLRKQLVGVDMSYFKAFLKEYEKKVTDTMGSEDIENIISQIIDEVFA